MQRISELVTAYGDASYDCGEQSGGRYEICCVEKLRESRKALMQYLHEVVRK